MATILINDVVSGTGTGPDDILKNACGAASAGDTVSIKGGDYTTDNTEIFISKNLTFQADDNIVRIWRIKFFNDTDGNRVGKTLTFSKKRFELFRDQSGYASLRMAPNTNLVLDNSFVDTKRLTLAGSNTITLTNSTLSIYEFTNELLRANVTLTGSTVTVGTPTADKHLVFYDEEYKTITMDLNSTLDVSKNIYAYDHDDKYHGTIAISTVGLGESAKKTYQLIIAGGAISTSDVTVKMNDDVISDDAVSGASDNTPYAEGYKFTTLGGHGVYLTKLDQDTVYLDNRSGETQYTKIGTIFDEGEAYEKLVGFNAGRTTSVIATTTSQLYLTKGNNISSSYGNLNMSSQANSITISTTGTAVDPAYLGEVRTYTDRDITLSGANVTIGVLTINGDSQFAVGSGSTLTARHAISNSGTLLVESDSTLSAIDTENPFRNQGILIFSYKNSGTTNKTNITLAEGKSINNNSGTVQIDVSSFPDSENLQIIQVTDYAVSGGTLNVINKGDKTVSVLRDSNDHLWLTNTECPVLYVNTGFTDSTYSFGDVIAPGIVYGVNTSASLSNALNTASSEQSICLYNVGGGYSFDETYTTASSKTASFTISAYDNGAEANAVVIKGFNHSGTGTATFENIKLVAGDDSFRAKHNDSGTPTIEFSNVTYTGPGKDTEKLKSEQGTKLRFVNGSAVSDVKMMVIGGSITVDSSSLTNVKIETKDISDNVVTITGSNAQKAELTGTTFVFNHNTALNFNGINGDTENGYAELSGSSLSYSSGKTVGIEVSQYGHVSFKNGTSVSATSVTNSGAITIDATSSITAASITNNGTITVDPTNYDGSVSMKKVIDLAGSGVSITGTPATATGIPDATLYHKADESDYYLVDVGRSTVYVDSDWAIGNFGVTAKDGATPVEKRYSLYNAFNTVNAAALEAASLGAELVIQNGTPAYDEIIKLQNAKTTIAGGSFSKAVCGGSEVSSTSAEDEMEISNTIDIQTGTFNKFFVGGNIEMGTSITEYTVTGTQQSVNISDGEFNAIVAGGDRFRQGNFTLDSDINMTVSGGSFKTCLAGGLLNSIAGVNAGDPVFDKSSRAKITGDVNLTITGGTFDKGCWIYGGCVSSQKEKTISTQTEIEGNVTITVNTTDLEGSDKITLCNIVVGSHGWGGIGGNATLVFTGNGSKIQFTKDAQIWGSSSGDSLNPITQEVLSSSVEGSRILSFTGFSGTLGCEKIRAFSHIEFIDSVVTLNDNCNLSGVENWTFENGSTLSGNFTNDFKDDTINLTGFTTAGTYTLLTDTVIDTNSDTNDVFKGFGSLSGIQIGGVSVTSKSYNTDTRTWSWGAGSTAAGLLAIENGTMKLQLLA